ncbi:response regulator transcription factor [Sutterella wadsworthensis]|uniref:response regulator transcription factor n=1 Tax=Sutterella wadsworthensis TaxID=40545 RepID=UPI003AF16D1E
MTKALDTPLVRIVDDDAEQLKSLAFLLRMGGWEVMTYQSAAAFLEMDDPRRSGCLLLDHRMPNMTGMELHETLVERGSLLPVIFCPPTAIFPWLCRPCIAEPWIFLSSPLRLRCFWLRWKKP